MPGALSDIAANATRPAAGGCLVNSKASAVMRCKGIVAVARSSLLACATVGLLMLGGVAFGGERVAVTPTAGQSALLASPDPVLAANKRLVFDYWRARQAGAGGKSNRFLTPSCRSQVDTAERPCEQQIAVAPSQRRANGTRRVRGIDGLVTIVAEGDLVLLETLNAIPDPADRTKTYESVDHDVFQLAGGRIMRHWGSPRVTAPAITAARSRGSGGLPPGLPGPGSADAIPVSEQPRLLVAADPKLRANKRAVFDFWRTVIESRQMADSGRYMTEDYVQHNPVVPSGRQPLVNMMSRLGPPKPEVDVGVTALMQMIAERDIVAMVLSRQEAKGKMVLFDVFRVRDGKVAEHWDSVRSAGEVGVARQGRAKLEPLLPPPTMPSPGKDH